MITRPPAFEACSWSFLLFLQCDRLFRVPWSNLQANKAVLCSSNLAPPSTLQLWLVVTRRPRGGGILPPAPTIRPCGVVEDKFIWT